MELCISLDFYSLSCYILSAPPPLPQPPAGASIKVTSTRFDWSATYLDETLWLFRELFGPLITADGYLFVDLGPQRPRRQARFLSVIEVESWYFRPLMTLSTISTFNSTDRKQSSRLELGHCEQSLMRQDMRDRHQIIYKIVSDIILDICSQIRKAIAIQYNIILLLIYKFTRSIYSFITI